MADAPSAPGPPLPMFRQSLAQVRVYSTEDEVLLFAKDDTRDSAASGNEKPDGGTKPNGESKRDPEKKSEEEKKPSLDPDLGSALPPLPKVDAAGSEKTLPLNPEAPKAPVEETPAQEVPVAPAGQQTPGEPSAAKKEAEKLRQTFNALPNASTLRSLSLAETMLLREVQQGEAPGPRFYDSALQADPLPRAAAYNVVPLSETFIDGVAGVPNPFGGPVGQLISPSARIFRVGPVSLRGAINFGADLWSTTGNGRNGPGSATSGSSNMGGTGQGRVTDAGFFTGGTFDFVIGEPATGHFLGLAYQCAVAERTRSTSESPFSQALAASGRLEFEKLKLGVGVSFDSLSGVSRDAGGAADRNLLGLSLLGTYPLGVKTNLEGDLAVPIRQFSGGIDAASFSSKHAILYTVDPKLTIGLGFGFGMERDQANSTFVGMNAAAANRTQTFESIFTRFYFRADPKLLFFGDVGGELRDDGGGNSVEPTFNIGTTWTPRSTTSVSLRVQEAIVSSSAMAGENYTSTAFQLSFFQQLTPRIAATLSFGYEHAAYQATNGMTQVSSGSGGNRVDNLFTAQLAVILNLGGRWNAMISYVYSDNESSDSSTSFNSSRLQLQTSISF